MSFKFKWKERETQQAVLFWAAVGLLIYWGVRGNFNVNELILGIVVYVLTGQFLFSGRKDTSESPTKENEKMVETTEPSTERTSTTGVDSSRTSNFRHSYWAYQLHQRHNPRYMPG